MIMKTKLHRNDAKVIVRGVDTMITKHGDLKPDKIAVFSRNVNS